MYRAVRSWDLGKCPLCTLMSHLLTGTKFSDFATFVFSVPWFRGSARSCHISFHTVKY